jgi:hypothetical protein
MAKPTDGHISWTDGAASKVTNPSAAKKLLGWLSAEKPPFEYMNWLFRTIDLWLKHFEGQADPEHNIDGTHKDIKFGNGGLFGEAQSTSTLVFYSCNCYYNSGGPNWVAYDTTKNAYVLSFNVSTNEVLLRKKTGTGTPWTSWTTITTLMDSSGKMVFESDTNIYRGAANQLKTDDDLVVAGSGGLTVSSGDITLSSGLLIGEPVAFSVHKNSTDQTVSDGIYTKVTWSTESYDTNSNFASDKFTPSVKGKYLLHASVMVKFMGDGDLVYVAIYKNGSVLKEKEISTGTTNMLATASITISDDANGSSDYYEVYVRQDYGTDRDVSGASARTFFQGQLIALSSTL